MKKKELTLMNEERAISWDNSLCEPVLITYNRQRELSETLEAFYSLAKTGMKFHVLDNASTDNTEIIVRCWQEKWPNLYYHKNIANIGGSANILRALEITDSEYSWVLGDDDVWHLEYIEDLILALAKKEADLIRLGWLVPASRLCEKPYTSSRISEILTTETFFFASVSMISATIVRRKIALEFLPMAYSNLAYAYPQLVPILRASEEKDLVVSSLSRALMTHVPNENVGYYFGDLEWYVAWFKTGRFLKNKMKQKQFVSEIVKYMLRPKQGYLRELMWILKISLNFKALGVPQGKYLAQLFQDGPGWRLRILLIVLLYAIVPTCVAKSLRHFYYRVIRGAPTPKLQCDRSRQ